MGCTSPLQVYVSNNLMKKLPAMPFPKLKYLDASWNMLENLPDAFHMCTSLETLELAYVSQQRLRWWGGGGRGDDQPHGTQSVNEWKSYLRFTKCCASTTMA